jgi:hypothetical protein
MIIPGFFIVEDDSSAEAPGRVDASTSYRAKCTMNTANPIGSGANTCFQKHVMLSKLNPNLINRV